MQSKTELNFFLAAEDSPKTVRVHLAASENANWVKVRLDLMNEIVVFGTRDQCIGFLESLRDEAAAALDGAKAEALPEVTS